MTQIVYYIDKDRSIHAFSPDSIEEIKERILKKKWESPVAYTHPQCLLFRDLLVVSESDRSQDVNGTHQEVAELFCRGLSVEEIGMKVGLSYAGVRYHENWLKRHYHVHTRAEMIAAYSFECASRLRELPQDPD